MNHLGFYFVLSEIRKEYWIPKLLTITKKILKNCIHCRKLNARTIKLNQSPYRDFRLHPTSIPFREVFIDHIGPFSVYLSGQKIKVYLLIITCLWSRAINLLLCRDLTVGSFVKAFQLHVYSYGAPALVLSDLGSTIASGGDLIWRFLRDEYTKSYFEEHGIKAIEFKQYPPGKNELGGLVESCVKITKRLIFGSIKNMILDYFDFDYLIQSVIHLANRRPIAYKDGLRDPDGNNPFPSPITPEILIKGRELISINLVPSLNSQSKKDDPDWMPSKVKNIETSHDNLIKSREILSQLYRTEFLSNLSQSATAQKDRYKKVDHYSLKIGDIVLIKDPFVKPNNYPMCKVLETIENDLGEVTEVVLLKGKSNEKMRRHVNTLIFLMHNEQNKNIDFENKNTKNVIYKGPVTRAAKKRAEIQSMIGQ